MCLGIPGQVIEIYDDQQVRMGKVDFGGVVKTVCLDFVPDVVVNQYVIVHVGFAITQLDEASAQATLELFKEIGVLEEELAGGDDELPERLS